MKINWKVRFKNKTWLLTAFIPHLIIVVQLVLAFVNDYIFPTGYTISKDGINGLMGLINAVALVVGVGGQVIDPTTKGFSDSKQALSYEQPKIEPPVSK